MRWTAAILATGDELTCGYRLDTNSQVISRRLTALSMEVTAHVTVGDAAASIEEGLYTALQAADVVIVTGGLGPTEDDVTRQVIASAFDLPLVEDAEALAHIRELFAGRSRGMPESNRIQAQVPAGSEVIQNERGTAAGFYLQVKGKHVFVTPGIPYEMAGMLEGFILPRLRQLVGTGVHVRRAALKVYGLPESEINERIRPMMGRDRNPLLGLLPSLGTITVEVVGTAATGAVVDELVDADLATLRGEFGRYVISEDERDLPQVVADLLTDRGLTIATVEMGTGGLLAARLTQPAGSERWFRYGTVLDSQRRQPDGPESGQPVQESLVLEQARDVRKKARADIGLAVGAIHIPENSTLWRPWGLTHAGVDLCGRGAARQLRVLGDRSRARQWAADAALAMVRLMLLDGS
jgi:nicotinamide-nucleotide amidase